jgi:hypothetical protein
MVVGVGGETHELRVGGTVFASGDRYVEDRESGLAYVLPASTVSWLASAEGVLVERRIHPPILDRVATVTVRTERGERTMQKLEGTPGTDATWVAPDEPGRPNQSFATFMDRLEQLSIVSYVPDIDRSALRSLATVTYANASGEAVERLELLRSEAGDEPVYYVVTDHTRVPGRVYGGLAEPVDSDLTQLF